MRKKPALAAERALRKRERKARLHAINEAQLLLIDLTDHIRSPDPFVQLADFLIWHEIDCHDRGTPALRCPARRAWDQFHPEHAEAVEKQRQRRKSAGGDVTDPAGGRL